MLIKVSARSWPALLLVAVVVLAAACGYGSQEVAQIEWVQQLTDEMRQLDEEVQALRDEVQRLAGKVELLESTSSEVNWLGGGVNYLAIGNSITLHPLADYWWDDDRGMAASRDERDYVHLVSAAIGSERPQGMTHAFNFSAWEVNGHDRAEFLPLLDPYLSADVDLVTLQLGENATDLATYEADWEELIAYVKAGAPNAQVVVVGDFWSNGDRDALKERACAAGQVVYVSLDGIRDNPDYQAGLDAEVEDSEGNAHAIEHAGVASHPGDAGMAAISDRVLAAVEVL